MSAAIPHRRGALALAVILSLLAAGLAAAAGPNVYTVKTLVTDASGCRSATFTFTLARWRWRVEYRQ